MNEKVKAHWSFWLIGLILLIWYAKYAINKGWIC